jgi:signal recognition particle subunit SRP54
MPGMPGMPGFGGGSKKSKGKMAKASKPAKGKSRSGNPAKRAAVESGAVGVDEVVDEPFDVASLPPELRNLLG